MSTGKPGRGSDQFPLRFPGGMRERIKAEAEKNGRSMNAEIVARLERSFHMDDRLDTQVMLREGERFIADEYKRMHDELTAELQELRKAVREMTAARPADERP